MLKIRDLKDSEILIIFEILIKEIIKAWQKEKKCLMFEPELMVVPDSEIKKSKDFTFSPTIEEISIKEALRLLGATIYHLVAKESEYNSESYHFDGYTKPLKRLQGKTALYPLLEKLLLGNIQDPKEVKEILTPKIREEAKENKKRSPKKADNSSNKNKQSDTSAQEFNRFVRDLMGQNCFLREDWRTYYQMDIPDITLPEKFDNLKELNTLLTSPCPFESGKMRCQTHFLFSAPPDHFTLLSWRDKHPSSGQPKFWHESKDLNYTKNWYNNHDFAQNTKNRHNLYLAYKKIFPNSTNKSYQNQLKLLPNGYEPPLAVELAMMLFLHHQKTTEYLYPGIYGRCQDANDNGDRVNSGPFAPGGLVVGGDSDGFRGSLLGLSVFRKLF